MAENTFLDTKLHALRRRLIPLWQQTQVELHGRPAQPGQEDHNLCRFTALFVAEKLSQWTGENWQVAGGSVWLPYFATGGFKKADGSWASHYWASNGQQIVDLAAGQFGADPIVMTGADDDRYAANYSEEELEEHLQYVRDRVTRWHGILAAQKVEPEDFSP